MSQIIFFFFESLVVGFMMAAPVGPVGVLCIRRTLKVGWLSGFTTGLGVAFADSVYGAIASLGLTTVSGALLNHEQTMRLIGGLVLIGIGVVIFRAPAPPTQGAVLNRRRHFRNFLSALVLAFTNPLTLFSFAAVYIGLGVGSRTEGNFVFASLFVVGVFLGSAAWWLVLSLGAARIRERITPRSFLWINQVSGVVIALFGVGTLISYALHR